MDGKKARGRAYTWGTSLVESDEHCDFKKLRNLLIRTHMSDLIETTHTVHYEALRAERLLAAGRSDEDPSAFAKKTLEIKLKEEEDALRKRFTEQVKLEEARFRKWEQKVRGGGWILLLGPRPSPPCSWLHPTPTGHGSSSRSGTGSTRTWRTTTASSSCWRRGWTIWPPRW